MDLAAEFEAWMQAHPNATNTDIAMAMEAAGVSPEELGAALGIDPTEARSMYDSALANPLLSEPVLELPPEPVMEIPPEPAPIANQPTSSQDVINAANQMIKMVPSVDNLMSGFNTMAKSLSAADAGSHRRRTATPSSAVRMRTTLPAPRCPGLAGW